MPSETFAVEVIFGHILLDLHIMEMAAEPEKEQNHWPRTGGTELIRTKKGLVRLLVIERYWDKLTVNIGELEKPS